MFRRIFCFFGIHDWREMNGYCCVCGKHDKFQEEIGKRLMPPDRKDNHVR